MLKKISPKEVSEMLAAGKVRLVDVREPDEIAQMAIPSAVAAPLSVVEKSGLAESAVPSVFFCNSGNRTAHNAEKLSSLVQGDAYDMEGGIQAWKKQGLVLEEYDVPLPIFRQIQIVAGSLILLGFALSPIVPAALALSAFVGVGLLFAGISGFCGMGLLLEKMPWNTKKKR